MEFTIEKMVYGGDGLARLPADASANDEEQRAGRETRAQTVLTPFVLPGERVEARVAQQKPGLVWARLGRVLEPATERRAPRCPYFGSCGGCHYQHAEYAAQLGIKKAVLRETLERIGKVRWEGEIETHGRSEWEWGYRNRTRMKMQAKPLALGYYKFGSHELLAAEQCPISSPLINRAIATLWELGRAGDVPAELAEIEFFANAEDTELVAELYEDARAPMGERDLGNLAERLRSALGEARGVAVFESRPQGVAERRSLSVETRALMGEPKLIYRTRTAEYGVSAGAFFQTNRFMIGELVNVALGPSTGAQARRENGGRDGGTRALDLYAGTGLFAVELAREFDEVTAVEAAPVAFRDLRGNLPANAIAVQATAEQYLRERRSDAEFDLVMVDPPRAGLGRRVCEQLAELRAPRLTYVSCDPATLGRDLGALIAAGYGMEELHLVDMFPQTYHVETVAHLARPTAAKPR